MADTHIVKHQRPANTTRSDQCRHAIAKIAY
jgi:hypothetical protein